VGERSPTGFTFIGGASGPWRTVRIETVVGEPIADVPRVRIDDGLMTSLPSDATWLLRGVTSYERYVKRAEAEGLAAIEPPLGRPEASSAALIPIRKSEAWWDLAQDERREIFEERSQHITEGLRYLPAVARRLHHGRDLGEPFDFLTWFEYAPESSADFEDLVATLRGTEEWRYVDREVDIRLVRDDVKTTALR